MEANIKLASKCLETENKEANERSLHNLCSSRTGQSFIPSFAGLQRQQRIRLGLPSNQTNCRFPFLLPGVRSHSNASTIPDSACSSTRKAGLGVFILDPSRQYKLYVKAQLQQASSVLMAEAASLALAAWIISLLRMEDITFLTDSQLLVNFFNGLGFSSPPHWDIKPLTQRFLNAVANTDVQVLKIDRSFNVTAHTLANQAFRSTEGQCISPSPSCTHADHVSSCPLHMALQSVSWEPFSLFVS